jgi:Gamma tubulin complex component C-terminal
MMEQIHLLAKEMLVLTQQLLYNILSARLHTNWQTLVASVKVVKSLRELEEAHDKYLDGIHSYIFPEQVYEHGLLHNPFFDC